MKLLALLPFCLALNVIAIEPATGSKSKADQGAADAKIKPGERAPLSFKEGTPMAGADQLKMRLRSVEAPGALDLSKEGYEVIIPKSYKKGAPHGLFIWISPNDKCALPPDWEKVLADHKLIFVGALKGGNNREVFSRMQLAITANDQMRQMYDIDPARVYVSGHSGGSRVASMLAVAYADMFSGAVCFMGVNFFFPTQGKDGTTYEARYIPHPEIATQAQNESRIVLVTGDKDFNQDNTKAIYEQGFQANEFKHVKLFDIPGQGHGAPAKEWLEKALDFLEDGKK
ncbi:MAG: PHB depolymerase family esterase [Verrucomicrobiota bacterium]